MKMNRLYHCTNRKNLDKILKEGLVPQIPEHIEGSIPGVYLSVKPFDWMHWATSETTEAGVMIEVDVNGLDLIADPNVYTSIDNSPHPSFIYPKKIPPERFIRISVSTDENPACFEELIL